MTRHSLVPGIAAAAVLASLLTACGADTSREAEPTTSDFYEVGMVRIPEAGEPVAGGTLTFGAYSEAGVLDPARTIVAGSTGGVEMAAVYDVLMQYDSDSGEVVPQLAESLEANEDATEWTLRLRDGVTFSDGSPLDAEAVRWSLERYVELGADEAQLWADNVRQVEVVDERTVLFRLASPWPQFPFMLTTGPGMIVGRGSGEGEDFTPVGAGAFELTEHRPAERMVLTAREDYWDGRPPLDRIEVVFLRDPAARLGSFGGGSLDAAFFRDPGIVREAVRAGHPGFMSLVSLGNVAVINAREGHPGADPRVRRAMALAIDPEIISDRAYDGAALPSKEVFPEFSRWHSDVGALPHDPEEARRLLAEAKADGYDGRVTYLDAQDAASRTVAVTVKGMLENVGFEVDLDLVSSIGDQIQKVAIEGTYDVAGWGISWREAGPFGRMFATLHSEGNLTVGMPTSPEMDALIEEFQGAATEDQQRGVMARIQAQWNDQVPALVTGPSPEFLAWSEQVHGVEDSVNSMVLLDDAWIED